MVQYTTTIRRFEKQGEKTGWTYIEIPADLAQQIKPGYKKSFTVKGKLDSFLIAGVSLLPMGGGSFIMPLNAGMRKEIGKRQGAMLKVQLEEDKKGYQLNKDFIECLHDEPKALKAFEALPKSYQNYYSKWIESARTDPTKTKRIALAVSTLAKGMSFQEMIRSQKENSS